MQRQQQQQQLRRRLPRYALALRTCARIRYLIADDDAAIRLEACSAAVLRGRVPCPRVKDSGFPAAAQCGRAAESAHG